MHSISGWRYAKRPNYVTNKDLRYPYSEVPYIGQYVLVKVPEKGPIEHVDYWGEGHIDTEMGASGFSDCYNVNHEYQLVSNGPDRDTKIPNRIPVISYTKCDTSGYINDNSVMTVTLMGAPINKSCATDIARIVNVDKGKVIIYGFDGTTTDVKNLEDELINKGFIYCDTYDRTERFKTPTLFDSCRAYLSISGIKGELYKRVEESSFVKAVKIATDLSNNGLGSLVADVKEILLKNGLKTNMTFAFKLWEQDEDMIKNYFPISFRLILNKERVKIINKKSMEMLKLVKDAEWQITPYYEDNTVYFTIMSVERKMFLGLGDEDSNGDKKAFGIKNYIGEKNLRWRLEPKKKGDDVYFTIINVEYDQGLKIMSDSPSSIETSSDEDSYLDYFSWFIAPW